MFQRGRRVRLAKWLAAILLIYSAAFLILVSHSRSPGDAARKNLLFRQNEGDNTVQDNNVVQTGEHDATNRVSINSKLGDCTGELKGRQVRATQKALIQNSDARCLRAVLTQTYVSKDGENVRTVSGFVTRFYDTSKVKRAAGHMKASQLLEYYAQSVKRNSAQLRFYDGIIDMDNKGLLEVERVRSVDEMLLLVFNDWDYAADKYLDILHTLGIELQMFENTPKEDIPDTVLNRITAVNVSISHVASLRRNAFKGLLKIDENTPLSRCSNYYLFQWPKPKISAPPAHIIAAIRPVDFDGSDILGSSTFQHTLQSPSIFFYRKGMQKMQSYGGPVSLKHVSDFVIANSNSNFQLSSYDDLRAVLRRFDHLALIICKGAGYEASRLSSPLKDILFSETIELRQMLGAVRPTFFVQEEEFETNGLVNWNAPEVIYEEQLQPDSLRFMGANEKNGLPRAFIEQLNLLPIKNTVRVLALDRAQLLTNGERGASLSDFVARILYFPAPSKKSDHRMWSNSFGMRLVDFVRDGGPTSSSLTRVTGLNLQQVYQNHFRQSYTDVHKRVQRASFKKTKEEIDKRLVVVVVLGEKDGSNEHKCEKAAFNAVHASFEDPRIKFVTAAADEAPALIEELRFSVWRYSKEGTANNCEVYTFYANGVIRAMDMTPEGLEATKNNWMIYFFNTTEDVEEENGDMFLAISHPILQELRDATAELLNNMHKVNLPLPYMTFRSSLYGTSDRFAPWFLWLPPLETAPLLVHVQKQKHTETLEKNTLLLIHDSSCGASTNILKSFRLFKRCKKDGSVSLPIEMVEFDIAENYIKPDTKGKLLRWDDTDISETRRHALYERLKPFLRNTPRLRPPQLLSLNSTHVISTLGVLPPSVIKGEGNNEKLNNDHLWGLARFANHMNQRLTAETLYACMNEAKKPEESRRKQYRFLVEKAGR
ncbi:hypothetical protein LSM04_000457 [Trypanosoma melophagium]|uniref:uncharacterized protein n=1 Tax=Trypanosoma melophagium TaxID=715481 RepID=UPI00351A1DDF|nr:hypothetical protein LSM04_000457 [Trypanosoma melophagium]